MTDLEWKPVENTVTATAAIRQDELLPGQYTVSLLNLALKRELIRPEDMLSVQRDLLRIFEDVAEAYTRGESSSLSVQTGEKLMTSIYYSLDAFVMSTDGPGELISKLVTGQPIRDWYEKGLQIVSLQLKEAEQLFKLLRKEKMDIPLEAYQLTIEEGISIFFPKYSPVFSAQDGMASIDYPLLFDDMSVNGIFYLKHYLETLLMETAFCKEFPREDILKVLEAYGKIYGIDYKKTLLNMFELLLNNALFSVLSGGSAYRIQISPEQLDILKDRLNQADGVELDAVLNSAAETMIDEMKVEKSSLIKYIRQYLPLLRQQIIQAQQLNSFEKLVIVPYEREGTAEGILLEEGERITDAEFRKLVVRLGKCRKRTEKISLIRSSLHSLYDFVDLLECDCLIPGEMEELFRTMRDEELTALASVMTRYERKDNNVGFRQVLDRMECWDMEWQKQLAVFLKGMESSRIERIEKYITTLHLFSGDF